MDPKDSTVSRSSLALAQSQTSRRLSVAAVHARIKHDSRDMTLPCYQRLAAQLVISKVFDLVIFFVFTANLVFIVLETDAEARSLHSNDEDDMMKWLVIVNWAFLIFYCLELCLRIYVTGCIFFIIKTNLFDAVVVSVDLLFSIFKETLADLDVPSVSILRVVRFFRLLRLAKAFVVFEGLRELYVMIQGLIAALRAIFWAILLIFVTLTLCSILAVQILHPLNMEIAKTDIYKNIQCERCPRAFSSVGHSILTFIQQIIAGDGWGRVSLPIIEKHPWTVPIFLGTLLCIDLGLMNLVLSAIVDQAAASRELDTQLRMREKEARFNESRDRLVRVFQALDTDGDGFLSKEELSEGYENDDCKRIWKMMDIGPQELTLVYDMMDHDGSGNVDYIEFIEQIHAMQTRDQRILIMFLTATMHKQTESLERKIEDMRAALELGGLPGKQETGCVEKASNGNSNDLGGLPEGMKLNTVDKPSEAVLSTVSALERLSQSIENDVLSSLKDVSRMLDKEVATNMRNSEILATLSKSLYYPAKAAEKAKVNPVQPKFLDGCTITASRDKSVTETYPSKGAPMQIGLPVDHRHLLSVPNGAGASAPTTAGSDNARIELSIPSRQETWH